MSELTTAVTVCSLLGYLIGGLNPAYIFSRLKGFDIRTKGSGNAGASNAMIIMGKKIGAVCSIFDILKAYIAVKLSMYLYPMYKFIGLISGVCCILGHIFPIAMGFRGGKGLASLAGTVLAYDAKLLLLLLAVEIVIVLITDYIFMVAVTGSQLFLAHLWVKVGLMEVMIFLPVVLAILYRHIENFRRVRYGVEGRFSYLWNKQKERDRVESNWNRLSEEERLYVNMPVLSTDY